MHKNAFREETVEQNLWPLIGRDLNTWDLIGWENLWATMVYVMSLDVSILILRIPLLVISDTKWNAANDAFYILCLTPYLEMHKSLKVLLFESWGHLSIKTFVPNEHFNV